MSEQNYPRNHQHLNWLMRRLTKDLPVPMAGLAELHQQTFADGALNAKTKELIAMGIAMCSHSNDCMAAHVHDAFRAGATRQEIMDAIGVAVLMGGESARLRGCEAFGALEQFEIELAEERAAQQLEE